MNRAWLLGPVPQLFSIAVLVAACGGSDGSEIFSSTGDGGGRDGGASGGRDGGAAGADASSGGTAGSSNAGATNDGGAEDGEGGGHGGADGSAASAGTSGAAGATTDGGGGMAGCPQTTTFYVDADGDGFGDPNASTDACTRPAGHVTNDDDCYDGNPSAKPNQMDFFAEERGDGSFDYDCDGSGDRRWVGTGNCGLGICVLTAGWQGSTPACGVEGNYITGCMGLAICGAMTEKRTQECR